MQASCIFMHIKSIHGLYFNHYIYSGRKSAFYNLGYNLLSSIIHILVYCFPYKDLNFSNILESLRLKLIQKCIYI